MCNTEETRCDAGWMTETGRGSAGFSRGTVLSYNHSTAPGTITSGIEGGKWE